MTNISLTIGHTNTGALRKFSVVYFHFYKVRIIINFDMEGNMHKYSYPLTRACLYINLDNYSDLSPRVQAALRERPVVPVGTTLVKANRLFFRLAKDLAPFFYEVPRGKL